MFSVCSIDILGKYNYREEQEMSQLIILGNTNKYTFCNAIVAAQSRSKERLGCSISEIYVIHSIESFEMLFRKEGDWLTHLKKYGLN